MSAIECLIAFPALLFLHLRRLARGVLNPRLAEHCAIVGVGGDVEHGGAVIHPRLGAPMRAAPGGDAARKREQSDSAGVSSVIV